VADEARRALDVLRSGKALLPEDDRAAAERLLGAEKQLLDRIAGIALDPARTGRKIRIHGDFHLGQVLMAKDDFVFIDFEGEPGRSLEERRAKQSPLRDVAGMLRSFDYAAGSMLRRLAAEPARAAALTPRIRYWEEEVRRAFLDGYARAAAEAKAAGTGAADPQALSQGDGLLGLFELEKALYELTYEVKTRPDWARIPLDGVLKLLDEAGDDDEDFGPPAT
jgi:maltose alpha-D-glucosyltransferase/alpha-amylase